MKILFITAGDIKMASTRFRVIQILPKLKSAGIIPKILQLSPKPRGYWDALKILYYAYFYDVVFIQKTLLPPYFIDLLSITNPNIIFDFDDAIYAEPPFKREDPNFSSVKRRRLNHVLQKAEGIIVGNQFLAEYAKRYNANVVIAATVPGFLEKINRSSVSNEGISTQPITLGWIGNPENVYYLEILGEVLRAIDKKYGDKVRLKVVSSVDFHCPEIKVENKQWSLEEEVEDISTFDIGIMPLTDDNWSKGKCGLKALEYMSLGIPVVASPIGVNNDIIVNGFNGFLAATTEDWENRLSLLIESPELRKDLGQNGQIFIQNKYSINQYFEKILKVIEDVSRENVRI